MIVASFVPIMKVFIKVLGGDGSVVEVNEDMKISEVKRLIQQDLNIPVSQQALVLMGKTLADDHTVGSYNKIKEGTKLHLVVKKAECLQDVLAHFLRKYYSEKQTQLIMDEFMKDFNERVHNLSLDDLERIATSYMTEQNT